jgi:tetratricopeptide (TPR) repeat protein
VKPFRLHGRIVAFALLAIGVSGAAALAHPGPHHDAERLTEALSREPNRIDLLYRRAEAFRLEGRFEAALADLDRAASLDPGSRLVRLQRGLTLAALRRDDEAEKELTRYLAAPSPRAVAYVERARTRLRGGRLDAALADFSAALQLKDDVDVYLARGRALEQAGRLEEAASGYRAGLMRLPGAAALVDALVQVNVAQHQYEAALALVNEQMARASVKTQWLLRRAEIHDAQGRRDAAESDRRAALVVASFAVTKKPTAMNLTWRSRANLAAGRIDAARADCAAALSKSPRWAEAEGLMEMLTALQATGAKGDAKR